MATGVINPKGIFLVSGGSSGGGGSTTPGGWSSVLLTNSEAVPITLGQVCYLFANSAVKLALSNGTAAQATAMAMCIDASVAAGVSGRFVFGGVVASAGAGKTFGTLGYLSTTAGAISTTPNLVSGQYNVILGAWINATDFEFAPQLPFQN